MNFKEIRATVTGAITPAISLLVLFTLQYGLDEGITKMIEIPFGIVLLTALTIIGAGIGFVMDQIGKEKSDS
jgi:hypothetical protein